MSILPKTKVIVLIVLVIVMMMIWFNLEYKPPPIKNLEPRWNCVDYEQIPRQEIRGGYMVFKNFIKPDKTFTCNEAVTVSTHTDVVFLRDLEALVVRFDGPISVSVYCPGNDYLVALDVIMYLRRCRSKKIAKMVTFHVIFDLEHMPKIVKQSLLEASGSKIVCMEAPVDLRTFKSYRILANLKYPINLARNIAKEESSTHFLMSIDVELLPTRDFSRNFLRMIEAKPNLAKHLAPDVFVLPTFEIKRNTTIPDNKQHLEELNNAGRVHVFLENLCEDCYKIPYFDYSTWIRMDTNGDYDVYISRNRHKNWTPFFVGTKSDPSFDERFFWGNYGDRLTQLYIMCQLGYNFLVLDDAFLVHKPGIKTSNTELMDEWISTRLLLKKVKLEIDTVYKSNYLDNKCELDTLYM